MLTALHPQAVRTSGKHCSVLIFLFQNAGFDFASLLLNKQVYCFWLVYVVAMHHPLFKFNPFGLRLPINLQCVLDFLLDFLVLWNTRCSANVKSAVSYVNTMC